MLGGDPDLTHFSGCEDHGPFAGPYVFLGADNLHSDGAGHVRDFCLRSGNGLRLLDRFFDPADHIERLLRKIIVFAIDNTLESADSILQRDELTG